MKSLLIFFALVAVSLNAGASTTDSYSFPINEGVNEENFLLKTLQTKIAFRNETVARTCYRTEISGYRNVCDYYPEVRCSDRRNSGRICSRVPVYRCHQVAEYRQVPYTCYQTVTTPYEIPDHEVVAHFNIKILSKPKEPTNPTSCLVGFSMIGEELKSHADCPDYLIVSNEQKATTNDGTGTVIHNYQVALKILDKETILAPLLGGLSNLHLEGHTLVFKTGNLEKNSHFDLKLNVERRHLLKSDETLIDRKINSNEYTFEKIDEQFGLVKINLDKLLGGLNDKKKHVFKVNLKINLDSGVLLNNPIPEFSKEASMTVDN